jgi:hypothetical protein
VSFNILITLDDFNDSNALEEIGLVFFGDFDD